MVVVPLSKLSPDLFDPPAVDDAAERIFQETEREREVVLLQYSLDQVAVSLELTSLITAPLSAFRKIHVALLNAAVHHQSSVLTPEYRLRVADVFFRTYMQTSVKHLDHGRLVRIIRRTLIDREIARFQVALLRVAYRHHFDKDFLSAQLDCVLDSCAIHFRTKFISLKDRRIIVNKELKSYDWIGLPCSRSPDRSDRGSEADSSEVSSLSSISPAPSLGSSSRYEGY